MRNLISKDQYLAIAREVLVKEAKAILNLTKGIGTDFVTIIEQIIHCQGRVIITGIGKSGLIGKKISATLASTGTPSFFLHPTEAMHGDLGMVTSEDIVIALSYSGATEDILVLIPFLKKIGTKTIGFVGPEDSKLAKICDYYISIGKVKEACPFGVTPTTSTTAALAMGDAIAIVLLKARGIQKETFAFNHPGGTLGKRLLLTVKDFVEMNGKNPCVHKDLFVKDALLKMTSTRQGAVSIVDDNQSIIGILTDGDIRRYLANFTHILEASVLELCTKEPITISSNELLVQAKSILIQHKVNVIPAVTKDRIPEAMIHLQDIVELGI